MTTIISRFNLDDSEILEREVFLFNETNQYRHFARQSETLCSSPQNLNAFSFILLSKHSKSPF